MIDLWCSLIYILDDFAPRVNEFICSGWLEVTKHLEDVRSRQGSSAEWQEHIQSMEQLKHEWGKRVPGDLKADPDRIAYWPTPFRLLNQSTKSHDFLKSIHTNLYDDISAEAHLKPSGLMAAGTFLCKDRFSDELKRRVEEIEFHKYKFRLVLRTMVVLLGTISEIEMFRNYPDKAQVAAVWRLLAEYNDDAKDVFEQRYRTLFT